MKKTSVAMMIALLAGWAVPSMPSHAQMPNINLMADQPGKTPEEKEADEARDKAYKETLRKIPDAKTSSDPWGGVRTTTDAPKTPAVKTTATKKPKATANTN
ncbi:hypothetical protein [Bradyrhizobium sp. STM 3557]|uniref:hypothetical protein n=1 Tax=Bradyrhizobium sp. STM 3557 TaxID=578920 RepID=UPI00388D0C44